MPFANVKALKVPEDVPDEKVLFLTDAFTTRYSAAYSCDIEPGDIIAIQVCGPIGPFATRSAFLHDAERVIAIDRVDYRLKVARDGGAETFNFELMICSARSRT